MQMSGEQRIEAPRERVWAALNDPEVLRRCIPGCQSLDKESDTAMKAVVEIKIGPIGAKFNGAVTLSDINPPESYTITGQGQGGTVGSAKGGARVRLAETGGATVLSYDVDAEVGGRLAQLGGPIIDATAKQLAGKFFRQFGAEVEGTSVATQATPVVASTTPTVGTVEATAPVFAPAPLAPASSGTPWGWIAAVVFAMVAGYFLALGGLSQAWLLLVAVVVILVAAAAFEAGKRSGGRR